MKAAMSRTLMWCCLLCGTSVTISVKAAEQYFPVVFILYAVHFKVTTLSLLIKS